MGIPRGCLRQACRAARPYHRGVEQQVDIGMVEQHGLYESQLRMVDGRARGGIADVVTDVAGRGTVGTKAVHDALREP
jgi:hypothetical protein